MLESLYLSKFLKWYGWRYMHRSRYGVAQHLTIIIICIVLWVSSNR